MSFPLYDVYEDPQILTHERLEVSVRDDGASMAFRLFDGADDNGASDLEGFIRWDGCINFRIGNAQCYEHGCGERGTIEKLSRWIALIYRAARDRMPGFEG